MSLIKIKNKFQAYTSTKQNDLQSTSHSRKLAPHSCLVQNQVRFVNHIYLNPNPSNRINVFNSQIYQQPPTQSRTSYKINIDNYYKPFRLKSCDQNRKINWTYSDPVRNSNHMSPSANNTFESTRYKKCAESFLSKTHHLYALSTPADKQSCKISKRSNYINSLGEAETVQSKFMLTATPNQTIEQSQIVFKGSRDIDKIVPIRLIYEDKQQTTTLQSHPISQRKDKLENKTKIPHINKLEIQMQLIKSSNAHCSLLKFKKSNTLFSIIKINKAFCVQFLTDSSLLQIYYKRKLNQDTIFFCEPYEYTLKQLYQHGKINSYNINVVCQHLQSVVQMLCRQRYFFFQIKNIENYIFYIHGKFKILPIFLKGKVQTVKDYRAVIQQIKKYLQQLLEAQSL